MPARIHMRLFDWFRGRKGGGGLKPAQACLLFVDGENSPPNPLLLVQEVELHAHARLDLRVAYGKWWPQANNTKEFIAAGFECIMADEGANNADLMLTNRVHSEVRERSGLGQTGTLYVAFHSDKGFAHLFNSLRADRAWKVIFVSSSKDPPRSLRNLADEVLIIDKDTLEAEPPAEKPIEVRKRSAARKKAGSAPAPPRQEEARNLLRRGVRSIVTGPRTLNSFTGQLGQFLVRKNFPDPKPKALYVACGAPKSWTTLKVLDHFVPELVTSEGKGSSAILRPASPSPKQGGATTAPPPAALPEGDRVRLLRKAVRQIVTGPVKVAVFNNRMPAFLASAGYPDLKTRAFYVKCGAPKSWTTLKVLEKFASDLVEWDEGAKGNEAVLRPVEGAAAG